MSTALSDLANVATILGIIIAFVAGIITLKAYRSATKSAADALMHGLFKDYLKIRMDLTNANCKDNITVRVGGGAIDESLFEQYIGYKVYTLEEMFGWTQRQQELLSWSFILSSRKRRERQDTIDSWRKTILSHAYQDKDGVCASIKTFSGCYSLSFIKMLADEWPSDLASTLRQEMTVRGEYRIL